MPWSIALVITLIAAVAIWSLTRPAPRTLTKLGITPPPTAPLANTDGTDLAIAPDGRHILYLADRDGTSQLYLRSLDELTATPIPGTEGAEGNPFFSPDGESVAFFAAAKLKRVSLMGGPPMTLCDAPTQQGGTWDTEDTIVFSAASETGVGLYRVSAAGGVPESLAMPDPQKGEREYGIPEILPGGKALLLTVFGDAGFQIAVLSLETLEQKILVEGGRDAQYAATGHLVYELAVTGTLVAVPLDLARIEVTGDSVPILEGVRHGPTGRVDYSFSSDGTLVYVPGGVVDVGRTLVWVDHEGKATPLTKAQHVIEQPRVSPDGQRVAVNIWGARGPRGDIFIYDIARDTLSPLTFDGLNHAVVWSPDGRKVAFDSTKDGSANIFWAPPDGSGQPETLLSGKNPQYPGSVSPDGQALAFTERDPSTGRDIWVLPMNGDGRPQPFLRTQASEWGPMFSPDGRWIAYTSDESGQLEVYVQPYPKSSGKWQISNDGGRDPVWSPDGGTLFYRNGSKMMAVHVMTGPSFTPDRPRLLFEREYGSHPAGWLTYDISSDGQRFVMVQTSEEEEIPAQINVVLNWFEELKRLVPAP